MRIQEIYKELQKSLVLDDLKGNVDFFLNCMIWTYQDNSNTDEDEEVFDVYKKDKRLLINYLKDIGEYYDIYYSELQCVDGTYTFKMY